MPSAKRARRERAHDNNDDAGQGGDREDENDDTDIQDAPPVEETADEVETAKHAVQHCMRHTMQVEMLNQSYGVVRAICADRDVSRMEREGIASAHGPSV
jgi:hypothetical protein